MRRARTTGRAGFTLTEAVLALAVLGLAAGTFAQGLEAMRRAAVSGDARTEQAREAQEALRAISDELRSSGFVTLGGKRFPHLFEDGVPGAGFAAHQHTPAQQSANPQESDFGPNNEVVYLRPADDDGDGVPDVNGSGELVWSPVEHSFVVVTDADGTNWLERRTDGDDPRRIASGVERLVVDDAASSDFEVPANAVRIRVWMRAQDGEELAAPLTVVCESSLYVQGDFNVTDKVGAAVIADAVNLLSNAWDGTKDPGQLPTASDTTFNVAMITGNHDTVGSSYNGGLENLPRFHEKWSNLDCNIVGSFVNTWTSQYATGTWKYGSDRYKAPKRKWSYDTDFNDITNLPPFTPMAVTTVPVADWDRLQP